MELPSPARVLLVDDEAIYTESLSKVLRRRGMTVTVASDGRAALAAVQADRFDVVLLDVKMPGMDGTQVMAELRAQQPATPVILMTGHLQADGSDQDLRRDAFAFLLKPHPIPELVKLIEAATARARGLAG